MTPSERYVINNTPEGDVHFVARKADAFAFAQKWADEEQLTYWVFDRMAKTGAQQVWEFVPTKPPEGKPLIEIL